MLRRLKFCSTPYAATAVLLLLLGSAARAQWVEDSVDVGSAWVGSMAYNAAAGVVYGCSNSGDFVFAISCATNEVISRVDAFYPKDMAYDSIDGKLYCTFGLDPESVLVVSGTTHQRIKAIPLSWAGTTVWDPVNDYLYVTCSEANEVAVIDCRTDSVIMSIRTGQGPARKYLNTLHHKLYVQNWDSESVTIVDLDTHEVIRTIPLDGVPLAGYYCPAVDKYYHGAATVVTSICGVGDTVVRNISLPFGYGVEALTAAESGPLVYAAGYNGSRGRVFTVDPVRDSVLDTLEVGRHPDALAWSQRSGLVYCANIAANNVSVLADDGTGVLKTLQAASDPFVFCLVPRHDRVYLGHLGSRMVYVIKDRAGGIEERDGNGGLASRALRVRPSPFRSRVQVDCSGPGFDTPDVSVFSGDGRLVRRVPMTSQGLASWDGCDSGGKEVPAGVYVFVADGRGARAVAVKSE